MTKVNLAGRSSAAIVLLLSLLLLFTLLLQWLPSWRLDLTEEKLYTLDKGSLAMLARLEQPITLNFYFSNHATSELPQQRSYAYRVRDLLQEYKRAAPNLITINEVDPEAFSEAEDTAVDFGLQGIAASVGGDMVYFGLVGELDIEKFNVIESADSPSSEVIRFFTPEREAYLEYDISQLIYRLDDRKKSTIGLISSLPLLQPYVQPQQPGMGWFAVQQLQQNMSVIKLEHNLKKIDQSIDLLLVVHPSRLSDKTLYAIDQYILSGAAAIIFVDPNAEMAAVTPMAGPGPYPSDLSKLFKTWGVEYDSALTVGDSHWGMRLPAGDSGVALPHIGIISVSQASINREDLISSDLEIVNMSSVGYFHASAGASTKLTPILTSSEHAQVLAAADLIAEKDHSVLLKNFSASGEIYILMARLTGPAQSAFNSTEMSAGTEHQVSGKINVIVGADTDMLSDRLWVQVSNFFGQNLASPWANNGDLLINAVDNMLGSRDLIQLRSRGVYSRPFAVMDDLRMQAADSYRRKEQILRAKLEQLEQKISALSSDHPKSGVTPSSLLPSLTLIPEQRQEIERFEQQRLNIRKQLRSVQHQLDQDIESLQFRLMLINFLAVPLLLTLLVCLLWGYRRYQRRLLK